MEEPLAKIRVRGLNSPFSIYNPCFLADDRDFMAVYYGLLDEKQYVSLDEFMDALHDYEQKQGRTVYPQLKEFKKA